MLKSRKAFGTIEIIFVMTIIIAVMIGFGGYIKNALVGRWKNAGDTFGQGKQYDPRGFGFRGEYGGTLDCFFDQGTNMWIDEDCYRRKNCDCTLVDHNNRPLQPEYGMQCTVCKSDCRNDALCN